MVLTASSGRGSWPVVVPGPLDSRIDRTHRAPIIPRMGGTKVRAAFVGRVPELERLDAALGRTAHGAGVTVLCGGEAGIGKTRLVTEFAARAQAAGAAILAGGCVELGRVGLPYGPFAEALRGALSGGLLDPGGLHPAAVEQLSILIPDIGAADGEAVEVDLAGLGQVRLFEAILAALERIRIDRPVVLIIEDVHWADRSTLDLLAYLAHNVEPASLLIVATVRTDEVDRGGQVAASLAELARRSSVERIDLHALELPETAEHLHGILGHDPEPALACRIHARSDGNPYFIEQLAWAHADGEADVVPSSLRDILLTQLSRQPSDVQDLLEAAAIAGPLADDALLASVLDGDVTALMDPLRSAVRSGLLTRSQVNGREVFAFRHALMAEAVEADLLDGERRRLHARCADALALQRPDDGADLAQWAARIAHHRERSGAIDETIASSIEAAIQAAAVAAHADAMEQYRRAIRLVPMSSASGWGDWDASELLGRAAACAALNGHARDAARFSRGAVEHLPADADPWRRGRLMTALAEHLWIAGETDFVDALTDAVAVIPSEPPTAVRADALLSLGFHQLYRGDPGAARATFEEARAGARAADAPREEALASSCLVPILMNQGDIDAGEAELASAIAAMRRAPARPEIAVVYMDLAAVASWTGHEELALEIVHEGLERMRRHGFETYYGGGLVANGAETLVSLGRPREAWELLAMTETTPTGGYVDNAHRITRAYVATALGDLDRAAADVRATTWPQDGDAQLGRYLRVVEAEWTLEDGRAEAVPPIVRRGLELPNAHTPTREPEAMLGWLNVRALADLAERARARRDAAAVAILERDGERALEGARALLDGTMSERSPMYRRTAAYVELAAAEATRLRGAPDPQAWRAAAAAWEGSGNVLRRLYARIREVEARLEDARQTRRDRAAIATQLVDAYCEAVERGAGNLARMAQGLARRARVDLAPDPVRAAAGVSDPLRVGADRPAGPGPATGATDRVDPYGLTVREVEILALLAEGLTNRQIGDRLFISPKTAGVHVSNILGKLGVSSRVHAATLAHRLGVDGARAASPPH